MNSEDRSSELYLLRRQQLGLWNQTLSTSESDSNSTSKNCSDSRIAEFNSAVLAQISLNKRFSRSCCLSRLQQQSWVGPVEWLRPYTDDTQVEIGQKGVKILLAVPISFVSEHIETLEEIDVEYKELALKFGIETWGRVPALGCEPNFISDLAYAVIESLPYVEAMAVSNLEVGHVFFLNYYMSSVYIAVCGCALQFYYTITHFKQSLSRASSFFFINVACASGAHLGILQPLVPHYMSF